MSDHYTNNLRSNSRIILNILGLHVPTKKSARRLFYGSLIGLILIIGSMLGIAKWYSITQASKPLVLGTSFVPAYARYLGVDPKETMDALIDIDVKQFRLVSYWSEIEPTPGAYNFDELDWQFAKAEESGATISLAVGLRQPRYPECHMPQWARELPADVWQPRLYAFMSAVVERYEDSPSLQSYQLENEFFNEFGECSDFSRDRLIAEYDMIKKLDSKHPIILSKSSNTPIPSTGQPRPDLAGLSIYRRVWDSNATKRYFTYPFPSWYYGYIAGIQKLTTGRDSVLHELQMESWPPQGKAINEISIDEQNKSMNADMFAGRVEFAKDTGLRSIDLWGAEWWYWRKEVKNDPGLWDEASKVFKDN